MRSLPDRLVQYENEESEEEGDERGEHEVYRREGEHKQRVAQVLGWPFGDFFIVIRRFLYSNSAISLQ